MRYNITDAQEEKRYPIFVTLVAAVLMFAYTLTFKPCSEVTNIGYGFSFGAVFGDWRQIRIYFLRKEKNPFFPYGSTSISRTSYRVSEIAAFNLVTLGSY